MTATATNNRPPPAPQPDDTRSAAVLCEIPAFTAHAVASLRAAGVDPDEHAPVKLLIDVRPGYAFRWMEAHPPADAPLVVVTWNTCIEYFEDLWRLGPRVLLCGERIDPLDPVLLAGVVVKAARGERDRVPPGAESKLTRAQRRILHFAARGCENGEIARRSNTKPQSVGNSLSRIYGKLGVRNRVEAGNYYWGIPESCG